MQVRNHAQERLIAGDLCLGIGVRVIRGVEVGRIMKTAGFDWIFIDLEHGPTSVESAYSIAVAALDAGITPIVRVPSGELTLASRCLDGGAMGIVVPHVETAAQARDVVHALRFPPLGHRSIGGNLPQLGFSGVAAREAVPILERATLIIPLIETVRAVENAAAIAAVPGVDALLIGANDLCLDMGAPSEFEDPRLAGAVEAVVHACKLNNKFPGLGGVYQPDLLRKFVRFGMRMLLCGGDAALLLGAAKERVAFVRSCL